jgi:hypothetical protein
VTIALNFLAFSYVLLPGFYFTGRAAQRSLILPLFDSVSSQYYSLIREAVSKYGFVLLEGNIAVVFAQMRNAYDPDAGAGELWSEFLIPVAPYLFFAWAVTMLSRLFLPLAFSFGDWRGAWKAFKISVICSVAGTIFQRLAVHLFRIDDSSAWTWALLVGIALLFTLYLRQAMQPPSIKCPEAKCGYVNPAGAKYCSQCRTTL